MASASAGCIQRKFPVGHVAGDGGKGRPAGGRPNFGSIAVPVSTATLEGGCGAMGKRYLFAVSFRAQAVSGAMYSLEDESQERPKDFPIEAS